MNLLRAALLAGALAAPAAAYHGGQLVPHTHSSSAGQGGSTLTPANLTVTSAAQFNAPTKVSSQTLTVDGSGSSVDFSNAGSFKIPSISSGSFNQLSAGTLITAPSYNSVRLTSGNTTQTSFGPCTASSTMTFTTTGGCFTVSLVGSWTFNVGTDNFISSTFLVDGAYTSEDSNHTLSIGSIQNTADYATNTFTGQYCGFPTGSHSICLTSKVGANTASPNYIRFSVMDSH